MCHYNLQAIRGESAWAPKKRAYASVVCIVNDSNTIANTSRVRIAYLVKVNAAGKTIRYAVRTLRSPVAWMERSAIRELTGVEKRTAGRKR